MFPRYILGNAEPDEDPETWTCVGCSVAAPGACNDQFIVHFMGVITIKNIDVIIGWSIVKAQF